MPTDTPANWLPRLRELIRQGLANKGISEREASRRAGVNVGYVGDILNGRSKTATVDRILKLAETLEFDASEFADGDSVIRASAPVPVADMLPVHRARLGARAAAFILEPKPAKMVERLPSLRFVPDAYACVVPNDLNAPRYLPGETIYVSPAETAKPGDFVLARLGNDGAVIAQVERFDGGSVWLKTLSGEAVSHKLAKIEGLHKVVACTVD